jgi:acetate kinase
MHIFVLNAGSGSQQVSLYRIDAPLPTTAPDPIWAAYADWNERPGKVCVHFTRGGKTTDQDLDDTNREAVLRHLVHHLMDVSPYLMNEPLHFDLIAHRVVHGGPNYRKSTLLTVPVKEAISDYAKVAGAHNDHTLLGITLMEELFPDTPQMAAFDTAFHANMPMPAVVYPGPYDWFMQGMRRYGFHGISHHYAAERAAQMMGRDLAALRLVTCHLGGGCSLAAVAGGTSVNTTMGFTPLEGVMMNNRSGSIDPGLLLFLLRYGGYTVEQLEHTLYQSSGLAGVSGVSNDLRELLAADHATQPRARLAIDLYIHRLRESIGAMVASLGGMDALIFTGGVGEHLAEIRAGASLPFAFMGLTLDAAHNAHAVPDADISAADATIRTLVIQAREEWMIAREGWHLLHA